MGSCADGDAWRWDVFDEMTMWVTEAKRSEIYFLEIGGKGGAPALRDDSLA